ncbi:MAG: hypothetical protein ACLR23_21295 [Clostridia bacterium]
MPAEKQDEKCTPARRATAGPAGTRSQIPATTVETTMPAEKRHEERTPVRRVNSRDQRAHAAKFPPSPSKRSCPAEKRHENARRLGRRSLPAGRSFSRHPLGFC